VSFKHVGGSDGVQVVPDLAVSLPTPAGGGTDYRFRLRSRIRYSTGRTVRPEDVSYTFERLFKVRSAAAALYGTILGADVCARHPASCDLSQGIVADAHARLLSQMSLVLSALTGDDAARVTSRSARFPWPG
jgi:ABC-type transport system substrate-binding protein